MSSDTGSDYDIQMEQFMQAADNTLFNNSMFQQAKESIVGNKIPAVPESPAVLKKDPPQSQRYIIGDVESSAIDFNLPESMQKYLAKKLSKTLKDHYEFYDVSSDKSPKVNTKYKSRVKLLKGDNSFVNPYEDSDFDTKGPARKHIIKRRNVDNLNEGNFDKDALMSVAVDGNHILSLQEVNMWAKKKERPHKVFHYKMASNGILHATEEINEFTELRRKNKWNEHKIKFFKKS